jgi:beta-glucosidase
MSKKLKFPDGFLWGAATSAHQVEGGNINDWSEWEKENAERLAKEAGNKWKPWQQEKFPEMFEPQNYISGRACDHYNRYETDFDIAKGLGHNAHRFSIEWSRIEPEEGKFNDAEIEHYRNVIKAIKDHGMEPFVTLWHWTNPVWVRDIGGWGNKKTIEYFCRYAEKVVSSFPEIKFWVVLNEPTVYASLSYIKGTQPPGVKNIFRSRRVINNLVKAHLKAYDVIHNLNSATMVGTPCSVNYWIPYKEKLSNRILAATMNSLEGHFLKKIEHKADFVALQYYRSITVGFKRGGNFLGIIDNRLHDSGDDVTDLDWKIYPEGIYYFLKKNAKYNLPIYITENGIADSSDSKRKKFIKDHLYWIHKAISEGVDVRGYFYWSLIDNIEFVEDRGFWPRFGLVEVDYSAKSGSASGGKTTERKIRPSAWEYAKICKSNELSRLDSRRDSLVDARREV